MFKHKRNIFRPTALLVGVFLCFFPTFTIGANAEYRPIKNWDLLSGYSTYFSETDVGRSQNIRIAAALIDGVIVQAYGDFSFNQTVGRRTAEAGFQQAKIIVDGQYVLGVGGGVCQVSTTLYNAAIKSGLTVTEYHPHTLQVSYIPPSRDAMVSTGSDLCFFNPYPHPVRLCASVEKGCVRVRFYGKNTGERIEIVSVERETLPPPPPIVKDGDEDGVLRQEKSGLKSEAYIERYRGNALIERKRLRKDEYRPVQGIIVKKIQNTKE